MEKIFKAIEANPNAEFNVDLPAQTFTIVASGESTSFQINGYKKHNLLNGFDDIDYLQAMKSEIEAFAAAETFK